ncbi:hypothetical protein ACWEQ4_14025 [Rhodococcus sp. NPDC003994]
MRDRSAIAPGARPEFDDVVGGGDDGRLMFDDEDGGAFVRS